jgi:dihydroneopterin aldolase
MSRDRIRIRKLAIFAYHGIFDEEARLGQRFLISLDCGTDLKHAGTHDDLGASVSYADMAELLQEIATVERFRTLEGLGERIARDVFRRFPKIMEIEVTIEKPAAPIPALFETIEICLKRVRADFLE